MSVISWVNDQLHNILGYSDVSIGHYLIALAKKSTDSSDFIERIKKSETVDISDGLCKFAEQLLQRVPHSAKKSEVFISRELSQLEQRNLSLKRLNDTLKPLSDAEYSDEEITANTIVQFKSSRVKKAKFLREHRVESSEDSSTSSDEKFLTSSQKIIKYKRESSSESDIDKIEKEIERDVAERDALSKRIRERDKKSKRNIMTKSESKAASEATKRLNIADSNSGNKKDLLGKLRYKSRKDYLLKRKDDMAMELEFRVRDDETVFAKEELTEREKRDVKYRKEILGYVKNYDKANEVVKVQRYHVPDATTKLIQQKYTEEPELPGGDGRRWEEERLSSAVFRTGAKNVKTKKEAAINDLLLDDNQIDFIESFTIDGVNTEKKGKEIELKPREKRKLTLREVRESLPVYRYREEFLVAIEEHQVIIIEGETGSGKTTQLPQYLYEAGYCSGDKKLGCTQPRRVAAMSVASRVAEEMGTKLGDLVGYTIRFEDCTTERTKLKYMTDGMLLREFLNEPDLASYSVLMIDEAHERTLHTDVLFGLVKDIARYRKDLKLLIASATLDAEKFSTFFDDAPVFKIPGRRFPVEIYFTRAPEADYLDAAIVSVLQIHATQPLPGDILVFLTGQEEIELVQEALHEKIKALKHSMKELIVLPIYANLPSDMQTKIFEPTPANARKVVLATNIAETSITIDGISYVIDPGFVKQNSYDSRSGIEHLNVVPISKAAADQRAGRAGRTGPGKCFRLYTRWAFENELEKQPIPEIQRTNLGNVVLMLLNLGISDLVHFDFLDPPPYETLAAALEHLYALGALNHKGSLTKLGRSMAEFPCNPAMSKMIIASEKFSCSEEIITIAAMLSVNASIFYRPKAMILQADTARKGFWSSGGDQLTLLNVYNEWKETNYSMQWCIENFVQHRTMKRARNIRDQFEGLLERVEIELKSSKNDVDIRKAITSGFFYNLASLDKGGNYKTVKHRHTVQAHPNSCLFEERPRCLIFYELVFTSKEYMREVIDIDSKWIAEIAPHYYKSNELDSVTLKKMPKQMGKTKEELDR